eukprot:scaffold111807_cov109-Phaeocystis_antarctica.AAC.4
MRAPASARHSWSPNKRVLRKSRACSGLRRQEPSLGPGARSCVFSRVIGIVTTLACVSPATHTGGWRRPASSTHDSARCITQSREKRDALASFGKWVR